MTTAPSIAGAPLFARAGRAAALGAIGFGAALWLTQPPGPGLTPDATSYLGAAESWAAGRGLRVPYASWSDTDSTSSLRVFPPGFPLAIGMAIRVGAAPTQGARFVQALAAGSTAATLAWLLAAVSGGAAAALGVAALLLTPAFITDHVAVLSEPLFLACLVLSVALMVLRPNRPLGYGLAAGAATFIRYAGASLAFAGVAWAFAQRGDARTRARRALLAALPTALLMGAWIVRTRATARAMPARLVPAALVAAASLREAGAALTAQLAPSLEDTSWGSPAALISGALVLILLVSQLRRSDARASVRLLRGPLAIVSASYVVVIVFSKVFIGHAIPFDERILSPLILCAELLVVAALVSSWPRWNAAVRAGAALVVAAWFTGAALSLRGLVLDIRHNGYDFAGVRWRRSDTLRWLRSEGAGYALFTNHPVPIYLHLRRPSRTVPESLDADTVRSFAARFAAQPSALVAFSDTTWEPGAQSAALAGRLRLREAARLGDGIVWIQARR